MKKLTIALAVVILLLTACGQGAFSSGLSASTEGLSWQEQYDLGIRYLSEGNYEEAIIAFTAAIEIDPQRAEAYVGRGNAYILSGGMKENLAAAQMDYEKAIELDETSEDAYLGLAEVYIRQRDTETALEILQVGLEKNKENQNISEKITELSSNGGINVTEPVETSVKDFLNLVNNDIQQEDYDHALDTLKELQESANRSPNRMESLDGAISIIEQASVSNQRIVCPREDWYWNDWIEALQSNTYIVLEDGDCKWSLDGLAMLENVTIHGTGNTRFIIDSPYDTVVMMQNCSNVTLRGLVLGHDPLLAKNETCQAGVINIDRDCTDILIEDCDIFGCGTVGIDVSRGSTIAVRDSIIRDCSSYILYWDGVGVFENCSFYGNGYKDPYKYAINTGWGEGKLVFSGCNFTDNMNPVLVDNNSICTFNNCSFSGNAWDGK